MQKRPCRLMTAHIIYFRLTFINERWGGAIGTSTGRIIRIQIFDYGRHVREPLLGTFVFQERKMTFVRALCYLHISVSILGMLEIHFILYAFNRLTDPAVAW